MSDIDTDALERVCHATFTEHDGLLLRDGAWTSETLSAWRGQLKDDLSAIEAVVNHMHLRTVFFDAEDYSTDEIASAAHRIQASWTRTLRNMYPDQSFEVEFIQRAGEHTDIHDFELTVRRKRGSA